MLGSISSGGAVGRGGVVGCTGMEDKRGSEPREELVRWGREGEYWDGRQRSWLHCEAMAGGQVRRETTHSKTKILQESEESTTLAVPVCMASCLLQSRPLQMELLHYSGSSIWSKPPMSFEVLSLTSTGTLGA